MFLVPIGRRERADDGNREFGNARRKSEKELRRPDLERTESRAVVLGLPPADALAV